MILSILIPCIPSRQELSLPLGHELLKQVEKFEDVEVLSLLDNKKRSIGAKRQALVSIARGDYVCFVDDDDFVKTEYVASVRAAALTGPDVVVFDSKCQINYGDKVLVRHSIAFENEQYNPAGFKRKPWHIHAWRRELAQAAKFPDTNYGEDWPWCEQMLKHVKTEARASEEPLYLYRFNDAVTEAR